MLPIAPTRRWTTVCHGDVNWNTHAFTGNISETPGDGQNLGYGSFEVRKANNRV